MQVLDEPLVNLLLLLGVAVTVVGLFHRLHIPSSLGYLLVGVLLGPHTAGPVLERQQILLVAEFGIVFLLFTIGLNFSLPEIRALRGRVLSLGTAQVFLTTALVGAGAWFAGLEPAAAFVVGAIFAQSSTTVISKQLADQGEEQTGHGRLGTALSVFQDVTAVPFVVVIPVLGGVAAQSLGFALTWAMAKAVAAFALIFGGGRWLLRPLFHAITLRRSAELFTLTVLFVALVAAWTTKSLGLSMPFGAFLVGMILGETEFRHQVESTIRPFRDVLLGLFFVSIGMLFDPLLIPRLWHWALVGTFSLLASKTVLVALLVRRSGADFVTAWRTGLLLAVGGEFGLALLALALEADVIGPYPAQVALTSVLFSIVVAPFLIRYNHTLAKRLAVRPAAGGEGEGLPHPGTGTEFKDHVIICGFGRIGQSVAHFLEGEGIPYVALDLDPARVKEARAAGEPAFYGDGAERDILEAVQVGAARLVVVSHEDVAATLKILHHVRALRPALPVMVRTRDEAHVDQLRRAGATEVVPETLEAGLMIASHALLLLEVPWSDVLRRMQEQRERRYPLLREHYRGKSELFEGPPSAGPGRTHAVITLPPEGGAAGRRLGDFDFGGASVMALVRHGTRQCSPSGETRLEPGDSLVLFGFPEEIRRAEDRLAE